MKKIAAAWVLLFLAGLTLAGCRGSSGTAEDPTPAVSGRIESGLRVLTVDLDATGQSFRVYRGDYVRFEAERPFTIDIDSLGVHKVFPAPDDPSPYVKFPETGTFRFRVGGAGGVIEAVAFRAAAYSEVDAAEASGLIANLRAFVLDVRTQREFDAGHLSGAHLIPVQDLQRRLGELADHRDEPVFVYCRSGNRSTVAAKLLVDAGFTHVINLRRGIVEWQQAGLPVVQ